MHLSIFFHIPLLLLLLLIAYQNYKNAVLVVLAMIPLFLARAEIFGIPTTWLELAIYLLAAFKVRDWCKAVPPLTKGRLGGVFMATGIVLFFLGAVISAAIAPDKRIALGILKGWFFDPFLFFLLFTSTIQTACDYLRSVFALSMGTLVLSVYGLWELSNSVFLANAGRLDAIFESPNYFAMYAVPIWILSAGVLAYMFLVEKRGFRPYFAAHEFALFVFSLAVTLWAIFQTNSYGGWFAVLGGTALLWMFLPRSKAKYGLLAFACIVFIPLFLVTYQKTGFKHTNAFWKGRIDSVSARVIIWKGAVTLIRERPFLGVGLGGFRYAYQDYIKTLPKLPLEQNVLFPHSLYFNLWLETGLIGLIGFLGLVVWFFIGTLIRGRGYLLALPMAAMVAVLIHGGVDTAYFKNDLSLIFWVLVGMRILTYRLQA